jgi:hypothetical protein
MILLQGYYSRSRITMAKNTTSYTQDSEDSKKFHQRIHTVYSRRYTSVMGYRSIHRSTYQSCGRFVARSIVGGGRYDY